MTLVSSCAALSTALKSAVAGAVITLSPGTYPACTVQNLTMQAGVEVVATGASFTSLSLQNLHNLTWIGGATTAGIYFGWQITDNSNLVLEGVASASAPNAAFELTADTNLTLLGCTVTAKGGDGVDIAGGSWITVQGCTDGGYSPPKTGPAQHPDMIQAWSTATVPLAHIWISGNHLISTNAPIPGVPPSLGSQGIDLWNDNGPNGSGWGAADVHIIFNQLDTYGETCAAMLNITDPASEIRGNVCTTGPGSPWPTQIDTRGSTIGTLGPNTVNGAVIP